MMNRLKIGEVSRQAQVNIEPLRYYERRGLLKDSKNSQTGKESL